MAGWLDGCDNVDGICLLAFVASSQALLQAQAFWPYFRRTFLDKKVPVITSFAPTATKQIKKLRVVITIIL